MLTSGTAIHNLFMPPSFQGGDKKVPLFLCLRLSKVEASAGLVITQNPLPPTPPKKATSLDFHGEECGILADKSNAWQKKS